jgi:hypothetical protein
MDNGVEPADLIRLLSHTSSLLQIRQIADDCKRSAVEQIPNRFEPLL